MPIKLTDLSVIHNRYHVCFYSVKLVMPLISETLKKWMREQKLSSYAVARLAGVPQSTVHSILAGETLEPRRTTAEKISRALGKSVDELYGGKALDNPADTLNKRQQQLAGILVTLTDDQLDVMLAMARQFQKNV